MADNKKITVKQPVIVEGKYDKIKLESVIDGLILTTDGFRIYKDKEKTALIRAFAEKVGVIILTDSDGAGFQIRNHLKGCIKNGKIYNVYIPDIFGKEKRKDKPSKEGKLGVEGIDTEILLSAFEKAGIFSENEGEAQWLTRADMLDDGLIGLPDSSQLRKRLTSELKLPERLSTAALMEVLNRLYTRESYEAVLNKIKEEN
ncbi:MAG: DUF4093 domain-containing protein [Ruminiclostridium sp.]|nr:DUF4093 domain-containing protein [Ruminiclostridium sp.]